MERNELTLIAAAALLFALAIGWGLRWVYNMLNPPPPPEPLADSEWAEYAKACEAARIEAVEQREEVERDLGNRLTQMQAENDASMESLGEYRRQIQELEAELDALKKDAAAAPAATGEPAASDVPTPEDEPAEADPAEADAKAS